MFIRVHVKSLLLWAYMSCDSQAKLSQMSVDEDVIDLSAQVQYIEQADFGLRDLREAGSFVRFYSAIKPCKSTAVVCNQ